MNQEQEINEQIKDTSQVKQANENNMVKITSAITAEVDQHSNNDLSGTLSQFQQLTAPETQALIQVAAQAMNVNSCQQLFPTLHTTNMALAASIVAAATAANSTTNESEKQKELVNNISSNKRKREPADLSQLPPEALKREIMNQKVNSASLLFITFLNRFT